MLRDLGGGLILRRATKGDAEALAAFNADQIRFHDAPAPFAPLGVWTRDLLEGRHPTFTPDDGLLVEETRTATGEAYAARDRSAFTQIQLWHMGLEHPLYSAIHFAE